MADEEISPRMDVGQARSAAQERTEWLVRFGYVEAGQVPEGVPTTRVANPGSRGTPQNA